MGRILLLILSSLIKFIKSQPDGESYIFERKIVETWPDGIVLYKYNNIRSNMEKVIREAMDQIENYTCVKFRRSYEERSFALRVAYAAERDCTSSIGYRKESRMLIHEEICNEKYSVIAQLMNVLGFVDEHRRYDRNDYVNVTESAVDAEKRAKLQISQYSSAHWNLMPYDPNSITHSHSHRYSKDGDLVIDLLERSQSDLFSNTPTKQMSQLDINKINLAYRCGWTNKRCVDTREPQYCTEYGLGESREKDGRLLRKYFKAKCGDVGWGAKFCLKTCGMCNTLATVYSPSCKLDQCCDVDVKCDWYRERGWCQSSKDEVARYMAEKCRKTCEKCN